MLSCGVSSAVEINSGVVNFTFLRAQHSFKYVEIHILEGTGLLSSPRRGRAIRFRTKGTEPACRAGGRRSMEQCSDTIICGAKLRGATRSAESRRMNTAEINAAWMNNRLLT